MRSITTNVYKFDELTDEAKEQAIKQAIDKGYIEPDFIFDEAGSTLKKFCDVFGIKWYCIDYLESYRNEYKLQIDDDVLQLSGIRLRTYIYNNFFSDIFKGKYYGHLSDHNANGEKIPVSKEHPIGKRHVKRYSKVMFDNSCVLTGMCYDDDILHPIYEFLEHPSERTTFEDLLHSCINALCTSVSNEYYANFEDENVVDCLQANDYEFTEDGEIV